MTAADVNGNFLSVGDEIETAHIDYFPAGGVVSEIIEEDLVRVDWPWGRSNEMPSRKVRRRG